MSGLFSCPHAARWFRPAVDVLLSRGKYVHSVRPSGLRDNGVDVRVSASFHRGGWEVRWRDASGRRRARRFATEDAARDARRRLIEQIERGEIRHTTQTFAGYWEQWLHRRRPYLEPGTWSGYEIAGRKRLLPAFGGRPLGELSVDAIREFVAELADEVEAGELAAKTVNNALGTLVVCINSAVEDGVLAVNPALRVQRLPPAHIEREYLRLEEIPRYLDACSDVYRPLAELLVGSGLRISEALALRLIDPLLEDT